MREWLDGSRAVPATTSSVVTLGASAGRERAASRVLRQSASAFCGTNPWELPKQAAILSSNEPGRYIGASASSLSALFSVWASDRT
jgi:hypothetical protein